jgi:F-type H+-transporting ATPase subunit b
MTVEAVQLAAEAAPHAEAVKESVLGALGIDWRLLIAQLINFSVVLFVMWKWVYTPLLKMIESRQATIDKGLKDAVTAGHDRAKSKEEYDTTVLAARKEAQRILEEAGVTAEKLRLEANAKAQAEVAKVVEEGRARLTEEKETIVREAKKEISGLALAVAEKAIKETLGDKQQRTLLEKAVEKFSA